MSNLKVAMKAYKEAEKQLAKAKREAMAPVKAALFAEFKAALERAPEVAAYRWTQYTPYFNDGEPCEFRLNDLEWQKVESAEADEWEWDSAMPGKPPGLDALGDDMLEGMFGDHVEIVVRRGARTFEVNEYDHD